jgi:hypothetical protein
VKLIRRTWSGKRVSYTPKDGDIWKDDTTGKMYVFIEKKLEWKLQENKDK